MSDIDNLIARVRELDKAAHPGPWVRGIGYRLVRSGLGPTVAADCGADNGRLIAEYRTAAPQLADECERLRERVAELEAERDAAIREMVRLATDNEELLRACGAQDRIEAVLWINRLMKHAERLEAALRPFAVAAPTVLDARGPKAKVVDITLYGDEVQRARVTVRDFLAARAALEGGE